MTTPTTTNPLVDDTAAARGKRLRKIRHLSGLNADELAQKIGYTRQSISYWENATHSGLSYKGAIKVVETVRELGVYCDVNWLLYGVGEIASLVEPDRSMRRTGQVSEGPFLPYTNQPPLLQEIELFRTLHPKAVIAQIKHEAMHPIFERGDWVGGYFEPIHAALLGKPCIVNVEGVFETRILTQGKDAEHFNLHFLDHTKAPSAAQENIPLKEAAKVIRVWRE